MAELWLSLAFCIFMTLIIGLIFNLFCFVLLMRAWMYAVQIPAFTPAVHQINKLTDWLVLPLQKTFKPRRHVHVPTLVAAWLVCLVQLLLTGWFWLKIIGFSFVFTAIFESVLLLAANMLDLVFWVTLMYAVMSFVSPLSPQKMLLRTLLEPILIRVRRLPLIDQVRRFDLAPWVVLIVAKILAVFLTRHAYSLVSLGLF